MKTETIEEFKARGGLVVIAKKREATTSTDFIKKDKQLQQLKLLYNQMTDETAKRQVAQAIKERYNLLKQSV